MSLIEEYQKKLQEMNAKARKEDRQFITCLIIVASVILIAEFTVLYLVW